MAANASVRGILPAANAPLLAAALPRKRRIWFGYLPLWSECIPLDEATGRPDWAELTVNVGTGLLMGLREALGGIVSASLVFSSSNSPEILEMLPWGVSMTLYTMTIGVLWYAVFGRLQYGYGTQQDLICILQARMAVNAAKDLNSDSSVINPKDRIPATVVAIIMLSTLLSGACSVLTGKLGLGKYMLLFPTPVTNGFLGAIGVVVFRAAFQTASGVPFVYFYPADMDSFCSPSSIAQVCCMIGMVFCIRVGPSVLFRCCPKSTNLERLAGLVCQLFPLGLFYMVVFYRSITLERLQDAGWTYSCQGKGGPSGLWATYSWHDVHLPTVASSLKDMIAVVLMSVMCTMMGALAIVDKFPRGPKGDPAPLEPVDLDTELVTVGASSFLLGLTGGNLNFHKFSVIQLRIDGGTHRISVLMIAMFAGGLFLSGLPIQNVVPKWYLAGLFMNTGIHFIKGTLLLYKSMETYAYGRWTMPSPQYSIAPVCVVMAIFKSPAKAILTGLVLSVALFLTTSVSSSPVINVCEGDRVMSRSKRPFWEMRAIRQAGDSILLLYLQGHLFFGSTLKLVEALGAVAADAHVKFVIISVARCPRVDPSAARYLKSASDRLRWRGCEVIFCRTNQEVFGTLFAAGVVKAPDDDLLKHLQNRRWKTEPMSPRRRKSSLRSNVQSTPEMLRSPGAGPAGFVAPFAGSVCGQRKNLNCDYFEAQPAEDTPEKYASPRYTSPPLRERADSDDSSNCEDAHVSSKGQDRPDAFCHETDALDYCDERIVTDVCYGPSCTIVLEPYKRYYRMAVTQGLRLPEWVFEKMNALPEGLMDKLRLFCDVQAELPAWTKLSDVMNLHGALCFILKGSLSVIQPMPLSDGLDANTRGFSFRQGKRLLKRYPPGHVAGKDGFFLQYSGQVIDLEVEPKIIVSSKMGPPAEIWVLRPERWATMPGELKGPLTEMLCVQFADDEQHSRLQEH